jgi:protoporphyrinogen oxidase
MKKRIAIIGAGVSGLSAARILRSKGYSPVVYEKNDQPGGLIRCSVEEGNLFHRVGGIVFNTRIDKVKDWFGKQFDLEHEFVLARRNAKIWTGDHHIGYPIENYLYQLPRDLYYKIAKELLLLPWQSNHAANFDEFLRKRFGQTLYEYYFLPYNSKLWNYDLAKIPLPWLKGKLPMPRHPQILMNNIFRRTEKEMVHSTFYYPKKGGSSFIASRLAEGSEISYHLPIDRIERSGDRWKVDGEGYDDVIYTGDVRKLETILQNIPPSVVEHTRQVSDLPSTGISNVLCYTDESDLSWLYVPAVERQSHRIVYTGNFSPANNGLKKKTCLVEFSGPKEESVIIKELKKLPGHLEPIAFNHEPYSYVIQLHDTREKIARLKVQLASMNFHLVGRFAEWEYHNMDKAILSAMEACDHI